MSNKIIRWIILTGWLGEAAHHYRLGIFAPEYMALTFGAIALVGILLLFRRQTKTPLAGKSGAVV